MQNNFWLTLPTEANRDPIMANPSLLADQLQVGLEDLGLTYSAFSYDSGHSVSSLTHSLAPTFSQAACSQVNCSPCLDNSEATQESLDGIATVSICNSEKCVACQKDEDDIADVVRLRVQQNLQVTVAQSQKIQALIGTMWDFYLAEYDIATADEAERVQAWFAQQYQNLLDIFLSVNSDVAQTDILDATVEDFELYQKRDRFLRYAVQHYIGDRLRSVRIDI